MIARRKLFGFLATSPLVAAAAIAKAKQPTEIAVDRIQIGDYEIVQKDDMLNIRSIHAPSKIRLGQ